MKNDRKGERRVGKRGRDKGWGGKERKRWRKIKGERKKGGKRGREGGGAERFMCVVWRKPYKYVSIIKKQLCNRRREIRAEGGVIYVIHSAESEFW